jgi:hypothetical protein
MTSKSYYVTEKSLSIGNVRRLDNLTGAWLDKSITSSKEIGLYDVETDPINPSKVFVVGEQNTTDGYYGVYVSSDGGDNWTIPGGNYTTGLIATDIWLEVCVIDSLNIVICGTRGKVIKSIDGGLTFNLCTQLPQQPANPSNPTVLSNLPVFSIHFINPLVGVVGTRSYVFATNDGGTTWMLLNGANFATAYLNIPSLSLAGEQCYGIHMSADTMTINVVCKNAIFYSNDGGVTFTDKYIFPAESGQHLTWINDTELWAFGKNGQRLKTTNGGASWFVLSAYNATGPIHSAGHMYSSNDGFFGETSITSVSYLTQGTSDSALTGYLSDNALANVTAIWTGIQPEECTACPEGYTELADGTCQQITTTIPVAYPTTYTVCEGMDSANYGQQGTNIYSDITTLPKPLTINGFNNVVDGLANNVTITQTIPPTNPIWGNNLITGRLNSVGVWNCSASSTPYDTWIGFSACIEIQETKQYYVGIAADNRCRFSIDGTMIFQNNTTANINFLRWYVFPIVLSAGTRIVYLEGYNDSAAPPPNPAAFGCEIYDFPPSLNPSTLTAPADLDPYVVFTTKNKVGQTFDIGDNSGYACPPGYLLSLCDDAPVCIKTEVAPSVVCFWQLTPCCEQFDPVIVDSYYFSEGDIGKTACIDNINGREGCYTISETFNPVNYTEPFTVKSFSNTCAECISSGCRNCQTCYQLEDCADSTNVITVTNDFAQYVGQVVTLKNCPDKCWIVTEAPTTSSCCWDIRMNPALATYQISIVISSVVYNSDPDLNGAGVLAFLNDLGLGTFSLTNPGPNGAAWTRICVIGTEDYGALSVDSGSDAFIQYLPTCTKSNCFNGEPTTVVIESFTTCEECLPPPIQPEPVKLFQRQVAPGYTTKVCNTDYVEKVNCKFADQVYNVMKNLRYGIATCCEDELQKWTIKKEWLTLEEMKDANPPKPTCYCYTISQNSGTNDFKYIDCSGNCQSITLTTGQEVKVCAMYYPKVICPTSNYDFTIVKSDIICTTAEDCTPPADCECYFLTTIQKDANYSYTNCNGEVFTDIAFASSEIYICAQVGTVTANLATIEALGTTCTANNNCAPITCKCYTVDPSVAQDPVSVTYTDCETGNQVITGIINNSINFCAEEGTVSVTGDPNVTIGDVCKDNTDCQSLFCACSRVLVENDDVTINYSDCNGSSISENLNPGVYRICSSTEISVSGPGTADIQYESSGYNCAQGTCNYDYGTCYYFIVNGTSPITYYYYDVGSGLLNSSTAFPGQITTVCSRIPPYSNDQTLITGNFGNLCNAITICPSQGGCLCYQVTYSEPGGPSSIAFSTSDCSSGDTQVTTLSFGNTAYVCAIDFPNFYIDPAHANYITIIYQGPCNGTSICNQV